MLRREPLSAHQVSHIYLQHGVFERPHDQNAGFVTAPRGNGPDVVTGHFAGAEQARAVSCARTGSEPPAGRVCADTAMAGPFRLSCRSPEQGCCATNRGTTSRIACVVAAASFSSTISDSRVARSMMRCAPFVDNVARWSCAAARPCHPRAGGQHEQWLVREVTQRPTAAPGPRRGGIPRCCCDTAWRTRPWARTSSWDRGGRPVAVNWANSRLRPSRADVETSAETRPTASYASRPAAALLRWRRCHGRGGGVDQHQAGDLVGVTGGEDQGVQAAEGVARHDIGSGNVPALQQGMQVGGDLGAVLGGVSAPCGRVSDAPATPHP